MPSTLSIDINEWLKRNGILGRFVYILLPILVKTTCKVTASYDPRSAYNRSGFFVVIERDSVAATSAGARRLLLDLLSSGGARRGQDYRLVKMYCSFFPIHGRPVAMIKDYTLNITVKDTIIVNDTLHNVELDFDNYVTSQTDSENFFGCLHPLSSKGRKIMRGILLTSGHKTTG